MTTRISNIAPVFTAHCPVHGQLVSLDGDRRLLGRCDGCMTEAAQAIRLLSGNSTRDGGSILGDRAAVARRSTS